MPDERAAAPRPGGELHRLLNAERERTQAAIGSLHRDVASMVEATRSTATDDEHDPEGSTIAFERSQASSMLTAAEQRLAELDLALTRLAEGSYGRCERCGEPIPYERLLARPATRTCVPCASQH
ncbi:MAG TPA: TraR/DksA C4-type zinc finger protein [Candidatus Ruania gallistercoris]|uniref:TraR/DksA C4-type zinc finger protein n=1 Tax=Candidatus Ruania gallistercoris TaxID=2838746 RepID=A0A9D2EDL8_9MICO|nr:TraR/DksA C4-type zinc finger protein [Candidatus Ruania gallistercoris]